MAERTPQQMYDQLKPFIQRQISHATTLNEYVSQYKVTNIPVHTHNDIDSPRVAYTSLAGVQNYLISSTTQLTIAQILTLNSNPIVVVPPPTKKSVIIVHSATARLNYGGIPYTGTHNLEFHYTNGSGTQVTDSIPASFINSSSSAFYHAPAVAGSFAPIEGGTGINGQIVAFVNTANPSGNTFTTTGVIAGGATSATLSSPWAGTTGVYTVTFSNGNIRSVTFTNGSTAITWAVGLSAGATATLTLSDANSTMTIVVHYHVVSFTT